uniref:Uncharacterized protein n=1 Tax=Brassica oleracea var. oleracea TaxID=109376 RepID=A0A0D3D4H8_BRAOL
MAETRSQGLLAPESELSLQQLLERLCLRYERPSYTKHCNLQPASAVTTFNHQASVPASTVSEAPIRKRTKKIRRIISREEIDDQRFKRLCVFYDKPETLEHYHKNARLFMIDGDEDQLSCDKDLVEKEVESKSFLPNERCDVSDVELGVQLIQKAVKATDFVEHHLFDQLSLRQLKSQKDWTFKYKLKKRSQHSSVKVCTEKEELQVVVSDNINDGFGWDHLCGYHEEMLRVCATEVEELVPLKYSKTWRFKFRKNKPSIALCGEQEEDKWEHLNGNMPSGFDCKESFILDVKLGVQLIQKALKATDFVEHHLFDQLSLRQLKSQKDWTFKYKLKKRSQHSSVKVCTEKEELQVVVSDNINDGFGWDHLCGYHEEMLRVCATEVEELVPLKYSKTWRFKFRKNKPSIALCGEQEEDKWEHLNGNMPSGFDCSTWQRVVVRGRCDSTQKLMAFYESVQSSWFLEIFYVSNGTGSFTIWHRWKCKGASTLYETKEAEKLKALTELIADKIKIVCPDELRVGRIDSSVCATAVEEHVLLKLYKSWQFKFRGKMETIKWTDSLIDLWKLSILTLSAWNLMSFMASEESVFLSFISGFLAVAKLLNFCTKRCFRNVYSDLSVRNTDSSVSVPKITRGVVYWSDLFSGQEVAPVTNLGSSDETGAYSSPKSAFVIAMACSSSGGLWQFTCSPTDVTSSQVHLDVSSSSMSEGYPRSLLWQFSQGLSTQSCC